MGKGGFVRIVLGEGALSYLSVMKDRKVYKQYGI